MEAAKQKKTRTAPNDLRKIPRMSTSSTKVNRGYVVTVVEKLEEYSVHVHTVDF